MKHRLRPQRSVNLLPGIMRIAMISRNSVIVACTPLTVVSRSSLMSLIITFMFEPAKLQMNWARASGARSLRDETPGAVVALDSPPRAFDRSSPGLSGATAGGAFAGTPPRRRTGRRARRYPAHDDV